MPSPAEAGPSRNPPLLLPSPPRTSSSPLPPRNNADGLPPTYLNHLRALLHQWLAQQVGAEDGLPSNPSKQERRLWSDHQIALIEEAIWAGAVTPQRDPKKRGLLELDWVAWILGAAERRRVCMEGVAMRKERESHRQHNKHMVVPENGEKNGKEGRETLRASFTLPGTPAASASRSLASTPSRSPSRPPSTPSTSKGGGCHSPPESFSGSDSDETVEKEEDWYRLIRELKGFEPYTAAKLAVKRDDWDIIDDVLPRSQYGHRNLPGAFPQAAFYDQPNPSDFHIPNVPPSPPTASSIDRPDVFDMTANLLKPIFCLHFESDLPNNNSNSTLRLQRKVLSSGRVSSGSKGSKEGNRWRTADRGGSGMTVMPTDDDLAVHFVEGNYALPTASASSVPHRGSRRSTSAGRNGSTASHDSNSEANSFNAVLSDHRQGADGKFMLFRPQHAASRLRSRELSTIISGCEDDVPREEELLARTQVVGGTIVIRGMGRHEEREAMERVCKVLLYTIQVMFIELEFLDAFRVLREPGTPAKQSQPTRSDVDRPLSPLLAKNPSARGNNEGARGFFRRLGKESRGVWDGLLGRGRQGTVDDEVSPEPGSHSLSNFASLGLPSSPSTFDVVEPTLSFGMLTPPVVRPIDRYLASLDRLQKLLPSPTPGVVFPIPPLLLRVKEEVAIREEKARREQQEESRSGFEGLSRHVITGSTRSPTDAGLAVAYRLGGDVKVGLGSLDRDVDTFAGWTKLQRLEALWCIGVDHDMPSDSVDASKHPQLCGRPKNVVYPFWDDELDTTVFAFLLNLRAEHTNSMGCTKEKCDVSPNDHLRWWVHGGKRVMLRMQPTDEVMDDGAMEAWVTCPECGYRTRPRLLTEVAKLFSWGKMLELLLYSDILSPSDRCAHATSSPSPFIWHLRASVVHVSLSVSGIPVYDTRLPKLQVGPSVAKRKAGKEAAQVAIERLVKREGREKERETMKGEIGGFFVALDQKLTNLKQKVMKDEAVPGETIPDSDLSRVLNGTSIPANDTTVTEPEVNLELQSLSEVAADLCEAKSGVYSALDSCLIGQINDVRRKLSLESQRCLMKLADWQKQHGIEEDISDATLSLPEYARGNKVHALPGSSVLVLEDEPVSLIAYTLSSLAYITELTSPSKTIVDTTSLTTDQNEKKSRVTSDLLEAKDWTVEVKRRDTPRDLLSLRTLAKKKSEVSIVVPSKLAVSLTPKQPSLELSLEPVAMKGQSRDRLEDIVRSISKATAHDPVRSMKTKSRSSSFSERASVSSPPQVVSPSTPSRQSTNSPEVLSPKRASSWGAEESAAPPSAFRVSRNTSNTARSSPNTPAPSATTTSSTDGWLNMTSTFTSSFHQLIKLGSDVSESLGSIRLSSRGDRSLASMIGPLSVHPLMDNSLSNLDDRPHIHVTFTLESRLKLSCTVYYAAAFDSLRRRCAIDKSVIQSLSRTHTWVAQGGKSKACFFMTRDKRYIVKELVSKWNVSDTHALLEIAPAYLEHLAGTHNRATALAKIVGFYTVKIHDLQTNKRRAMDLLVMENVFHKQDITQTFDLKGIEARRAVKSTGAGDTLFDADWLDQIGRSPILIYPHATRILAEAISFDTRFLSSQSIMDYSLLLGLDPSKSELVVGLVDVIGSYNLFKTIESRGKTMINRGGDIAPEKYRDRFENALKQYFVVCPDKWLRSKRGMSDGLPAML